MVPWEVVGDQVVKKVLSDGPWAELSCVVSSVVRYSVQFDLSQL